MTEDNLLKGAGATMWKALQPFLSPEISVQAFVDAYTDIIDEDNIETGYEKLGSFVIEIMKSLQPGFTQSLGRVISPKVWTEDLEENPNLKNDKRFSEFLTMATGVRLSELDVTKGFRFNRGKELLKQEARSKIDIQKLARDKKFAEAEALLPKATEDYNTFLDNTKQEIEGLRKLGVSNEKIEKMLSSTRIQKGAFSKKEIAYIMGGTDAYPPLVISALDKKKTSGKSSTSKSSGFKRSGSRKRVDRG